MSEQGTTVDKIESFENEDAYVDFVQDVAEVRTEAEGTDATEEDFVYDELCERVDFEFVVSDVLRFSDHNVDDIRDFDMRVDEEDADVVISQSLLLMDVMDAPKYTELSDIPEYDRLEDLSYDSELLQDAHVLTEVNYREGRYDPQNLMDYVYELHNDVDDKMYEIAERYGFTKQDVKEEFNHPR